MTDIIREVLPRRYGGVQRDREFSVRGIENWKWKINEGFIRELTHKMYLRCRSYASCAKEMSGKKVETKGIFIWVKHGVQEGWTRRSEKKIRSRITEVPYDPIRSWEGFLLPCL